LAKVANNDLSSEDYNLIVKECESKGTYIIRVRKGKTYLYSSLPAVRNS
jgi:hypothetical protein